MKERARTPIATPLCAALALLAAAPASADPVTLRWRYAEPSRAAGFRALVGSESGRVAQRIDLGRPTPDASGVYRVEIEVPDAALRYVSIVAYDAAGAESPRSNEWLRPAGSAELGAPGRPEVVDP